MELPADFLSLGRGFVNIDPILFYSPESILTGIILIHKLHKSLISYPKLSLLTIASACAFLAFHVNYMHLIL